MTQTKKIEWSDKVGAISAFLCIVHCLTVPSLLAMGVGFISHPLIALLFIIIAFISIYKTTKNKISSPESVFLWISFTGFLISILFEESAVLFEYTMYIFSIAIVLGHFYNMR